MPTMASITVKNRANTDVIYAAVTPSAGDRSPAVWRQNAASSIIGHRPSFSAVTRDNGKKNGRIMQLDFVFPVTEVNPVTGRTEVLARVPASTSVTLPTNVDSNKVADGFHQYGNLIVSSIIRAMSEEGSSPT